MKKTKILLLAPVFALLVSCSKAPSNYDQVKKNLPSGGEEVAETADKGAALLKIVNGVVDTLGESSQKHVLHLDASVNHVPLRLTEEEKASEAEVYHDFALNLDAEFAISVPQEGSSGLYFTVKDLDVSISNFIDIKDVQLSLGYNHTAEKGAFLYVDLSNQNLLNAIGTVTTALGYESIGQTVTQLIGEGKIMLNADLLVKMVADLLPDFAEAGLLQLPDGMEIDQVVAQLNGMTGKKIDFLSMISGYIPNVLPMLKTMISKYVSAETLNRGAELLKDYLSVATYKTEDVVTKYAAALNLSNEQFHGLVDPKEPEVTNARRAEDGSENEPVAPSFPQVDVTKVTVDAGAMVAVGHNRGQVNEKMTLESIAVSLIGSFEDYSARLNLTEEAYYGDQVGFEPVSLEGYQNLTSTVNLMLGSLEEMIRSMLPHNA